MQIYQAIILGLIQGFTEFLPVSSSGHLAIASNLFSIENSLFFDTVLHLATLLPLIIVFRKEIALMLKNPNKILLLIIATIPAGVVGIFFSSKVEKVLSNNFSLAICFFIGASIMLISSFIKKGKNKHGIKSMILVGLFEAVAVFPGISRSGTVISGGNFLKIDEEENRAFSFILSIPIIVSSVFFSAIKCETISPIAPTILGFLSALVGGFISVLIMKKISLKSGIKGFAIYLYFVSIMLFIFC